LARLLIDALAAGFDPKEYRDRYRENLRALIDAKIQEQPTTQALSAALRRPVIDILDALKSSLASAKKPMRAAQDSSVSSADPGPEMRRRPRRRA
jgi:DNA end-binding protein Ku